MPRPRKPTALALIDGSAKHDPQRFRDRMNAPDPAPGLGRPPTHLSKEEKKAWKEIEKQAAPGVLTISDRLHVEQLCRLIARSRAPSVEVEGVPVPHPVALYKAIESMLGKLGFNPSDRSRISTGAKDEKPSGFSDL